jgi:hypothetical protein
MSGRGGRRAGAGRKSIASKRERVLAGAYMESMWQALRETSTLNKRRTVDIEQARKVLHDLHPNYRKHVLKYAEQEDADLDALPLRVADAVLELRQIIDTLRGPQQFEYSHLRGMREAFLAQMAQDLSTKLRRPITAELARHWLDDYRAWCKKQRTLV